MKNAGWLALTCAIALVPMLQGCTVATVGVGAVANDRRTTGTQIDDEGIEVRASNRISERWGDKVHVNVTSFNRSVLLTGEVSNESIKVEIEKVIGGVANVRGVTNDIAVAGASALSSRANDTYLTSKVKARFVDANYFNPFHVKVVTENGTSYLLGIVTEQEAKLATDIARTTGGIRKVVRLFDYCKTTDDVCRPSAPSRSEASPPPAKR